MPSFIRKVFGKEKYSEQEELVKSFLTGNLAIAIPINIKAFTILDMFERCIIKPFTYLYQF